MAENSLIKIMSGRLKQEAYINNPDARNFLADVATVILHILLNDGKYNIQIDKCLDNIKHRIFEYSVKQISLSEDLNFFQNKNELSLVNIYLGMLDINFSFDEIRNLVLLFNGVNDVRNDYKIILESQVAKMEEEIPKEEIEPLVINKLTEEIVIIHYFSRKVASGYYKNIYKLLVDFTLMVYRKGSTSVDLSFPSFNDTITYINKSIYTYWVHAKPAEELEHTFTYIWKKAKPLHLNRAVLAFRIPYAINKDGDFIQVELGEFRKETIEVLRQPIEDRKIVISRAKYTVEYPASFMLVASTNPCPCGYYGDPTHHCVCTPGQIAKYMSKFSGPMMDRIDLQVECQALSYEDLSKAPTGEPSSVIRERVLKARQIQERRFQGIKGVHCNAQMTERMIHQYAEPDENSLALLRMGMERLKLSARAYNRILKVARTIADLEGSENVQSQHIAEAIGYRNLDRGDWAERGL